MMAATADNTSTLSFQASASNAWLPMRRLARIFDTIITALTASARASGHSVYTAGGGVHGVDVANGVCRDGAANQEQRQPDQESDERLGSTMPIRVIGIGGP